MMFGWIWMIFDWFWMDFCCQLQSPKLETSMMFRVFFDTFSKIGFSMLISIFVSILVPACFQCPSEDASAVNDGSSRNEQ